MSATKQQTAVQWLVAELIKLGYLHSSDYGNSPKVLDALNQANAKHEEQICTAYLAGDCQNMLPHEYFKETYD